MSNSFSISIVLVFAFLQSVGFSRLVQADHNESLEPSPNIKIIVDGKQVDAQIGQEMELLIDGKTARILVTEGDERELQLRHLRFRYPAYFKFEVSFKSGTRVPVEWDLEGHDVDVTVFRVSSDNLRYQKCKHPLGDCMSKILGKKAIAGDVRILELGQMKIQGTRYTVPISLDSIDINSINLGSIDFKMSFDVFEVPGSFGDVRYFLLLSGWDGENPKEERLVRNLLCKSFRVGEKFSKIKREP